MKIDIGDKVRFLNDVGGGTVTSIINKEMVNVETNDGFEVPTYIKNLVIVGSGESGSPKTLTQAIKIEKEPSANYQEKASGLGFVEQSQIKGNDFPEFVFAFVPDNQATPPEGNISMYLINDCNFTLLYQFSVKSLDNYETIDAGNLEPNTKIKLGTIKPEKLSELPTYCFQLLYFKKFSSQLEDPIQKEVVISSVKFFKPTSFIKTNYFKTPSLIVRLVDNPLKAELEKLTERDFQQIVSSKEPKSIKTPQVQSLELVEIDLHIGQLIDNLQGMSNADMLKTQMETFRKEMQNGLQTGIKKIVFIHGVGDGVLKNELRRELQRKYAKYPFQDASFREYGYGATMVILKR